MKILLVDDVRLFLELEKTFLRRLECDILTASSGEEALAIARVEKPALVVLDDQMPGIGGLETCRRMKADPALAGILVLMASAPEVEQTARGAGADGFMPKPLGQQKLTDRVRAMLPGLQPRRNERAFVRLEVEATFDGPRLGSWTRDLSATGMFVLSDESPDPGSRVLLRFRVPGTERPVVVEGEVRNTVPVGAAGRLSPGFGVLFHGLPADEKTRIAEFVRRVESGD